MERKLPFTISQPLSDEYELWQLFKAGDAEALASIFLHHYRTLFCYGMKLVPDEEIVKDCIQNLFEKLWNSREKVGDVSLIVSYLRTALRHLIIDEQNRTINRSDASAYCVIYRSYTHSPEEVMIDEQTKTEQSRKLKKMLGTLSKRQREAIHLRTYEELEYDKISEKMSLNTQSVRNLIHQSIKKLRKYYLDASVTTEQKWVATPIAGRNQL